MSDLETLREKIDKLDTQLLDLLNQRAEVACAIGEIKHREGLPIYAPEREEKLLRSLVERSQGPLRAEAIRAIYREIMSASLSLEKDVIIACFAGPGLACHQAARSKFGSSVRYTFHQEIDEVFAAVARNEADCGVVPIEGTDNGPISQTLDALAETDLSICAEIIMESENPGENVTSGRYLVLGRAPNPPSGDDQTLIVLRIQDKPGALVSALEPFKTGEINLGHFASRPASKGSEDIFFFVEASGHTRDMQSADLFRELSKRCRAVKVLGSYPKVSR